MMKRKYPNVYVDKNGKPFYNVLIGRDQNGKQKFKKGRRDSNGKPFKSERAASLEAARIKSEYLVASGREVFRLNYATFLREKFMPAYKGDVENSTYKSHLASFRYATKRFGKKLLEDISSIDCEEYRTWLSSESGFSKSYASMCYISFRQTLDYAVRIGYLKTNESKRTKSISKGKAIVKYWTKSQFEQVISQTCISDFHEHLCFIMIWLYFMTGIRVSEGLALTWDDVDLNHDKLRVHHTLDYKNKSNFTVKPYTKTSSGKRTISLDKDTVKYLSDWKKVQMKHGFNRFILSYDGMPMSRTTVNVVVTRYAKLAGVPVIQAKGLRHSHVSYLINEINADVLTISRRLGHSSPDITLKYYAHLWDRNDDGLAEKMTGNISFKSSITPSSVFNGNQHLLNE